MNNCLQLLLLKKVFLLLKRINSCTLYIWFKVFTQQITMTETIIEYYTASHPMPLVFVADMALIYFKGESKGYQIRSRFLEHIAFDLDHIIEKGGDFKVINSQQNDMRICVTNASGVSVIGITSRDVIWTKWWTSFIKIQKRLNYVLWKRHGPRLRLIAAFKKTDRAKLIPSEIMSVIIHAYFEPPSRPRKCTKNGHTTPIRIVQTNSFKKLLNLSI